MYWRQSCVIIPRAGGMRVCELHLLATTLRFFFPALVACAFPLSVRDGHAFGDPARTLVRHALIRYGYATHPSSLA